MSACVFCRIAEGTLPANVVHQDAAVVAFLDTSPLALGHVLVVPRPHVATLDELDPAAVGTLFDAARRVSIAVQRGLGADGSFIAVNTRVSQSVPHVHVHVVPRRSGDGLFSPRPIWRRRSYAGPAEAAEHAARVREALPEA